MSVADIFKSMASHMIEGMMVHEQLMNSYMFLGLQGYAACHTYHYLSESCGYIRLCRYASDHLDILIPSDRPENPAILPESWKRGKRTDVTPAMRREALEAAIREWIKWETGTVELYSGFYKELLDSGQIPVAEFVKKYAADAEEEIAYAKNDLIHKSAMNFDIISILEEQSELEKCFRKKIKKIGEETYENE